MEPTQYEVSPKDSRYIPFTQQESCCVPTSIQMIMYRNGIPLIPAEELGYHLGLVVHTDDGPLFYDARTADTPPVSGGFGTQIRHPEHEPNTVFRKLGIPLQFSQTMASEMSSEDDLLDKLSTI